MNSIVLTMTKEEKVCLDLNPKEERTVDERALSQMGFTREEIALAKLFYGRATPGGVIDAVRYAVWALRNLPRADANGVITPATYYEATRGGIRQGGNRLAHWAGAAFRAYEREGSSPQPALFGILRKALDWCGRFEEENPPEEWPHERIEELLAAKRHTRTITRETSQTPTERVTVEVSPEEPIPEIRVAGDQLSLFSE
ncbi:MAG TPA: hypothetical protein DCP08_02825 [Chloroflexi bacterium]|nr:hypothetical protein [Chloroflexota bacterium]